jgi:TRAP-type C4-dicarboxylate transport system substrate-binding protein
LKVKKHVFTLLAALLLVFLVGALAACGGDDATDTTASTAAAPAGSDATTENTDAGTAATEATETTAAAKTEGRKVLRWASPHPLGDPVTVPQEEFVAAFNAAQDKYTIELHASGALMGMPDEFEALQNKAVEIAEWPVAVFGSVVPELNLAELPFAVNSIEADAAYNQKMHPIYAKAVEKYNMRPVFVFTCQGLDVISLEPIKTIDDWKGLLCQTISPVTAGVVKVLGGSGVAMDFTEGYQGLQKKVIEATLQSGTFVNMFKLYEVAKNVTRAYLTPAAIGIFINQDVYNEMPDDIKAIFDKLAAEAEVATNAKMIELYYSELEEMKKNGMNTYNIPAAERAVWAEKVKPFSDEILSKVDPAVADEVRKIAQELDQQFPYVE